MFDIDITNIKNGKKFYYPFLFIGIIFSLGFIFMIVSTIFVIKFFNASDTNTILGGIMIIFVPLIPLVFVVFALYNIKLINKRIKAIEQLNQTGKLVKNIPYRLENSNLYMHSYPIQRPVIDYTLKNNEIITLYGDPRHDKKHFDADGMVDLLIDENNPSNYFIDFEINRLSGNLEQDYYQNNK